MRLRIAAAAVAALAATGCVSTFSYIDGDKYFKTNLNTYSVIVLDVDGVSRVQNPVMVTKFGPSQVRVQAPPPPGWLFGDIRTLNLDVKPCTHYYLKAVKTSPLALDFVPEVDYEEPISGCKVE